MPTLHLAIPAPALAGELVRILPRGWGVGDLLPDAVIATPETAEAFLPGKTKWPDAALIVVGESDASFGALLELQARGADAVLLRTPTASQLADVLTKYALPFVHESASPLTKPDMALLTAQQVLRGLPASTRLIMSTLVDALQVRDPYRSGHCHRVALGSVVLGLAMDLPVKVLERVALASTLHDIGKLGLSDDVLRKPGKLDEGEAAEMRTHPRIGAELVSRYPVLRPAVTGVLQHHEYWDGSGYPFKKGGEDLALEARIISVVDAYDSITSDRPYRQGRESAVAIAEIVRCSGTQFDPDIAALFVRLSNMGAFPAEHAWPTPAQASQIGVEVPGRSTYGATLEAAQ